MARPAAAAAAAVADKAVGNKRKTKATTGATTPKRQRRAAALPLLVTADEAEELDAARAIIREAFLPYEIRIADGLCNALTAVRPRIGWRSTSWNAEDVWRRVCYYSKSQRGWKPIVRMLLDTGLREVFVEEDAKHKATLFVDTVATAPAAAVHALLDAYCQEGAAWIDLSAQGTRGGTILHDVAGYRSSPCELEVIMRLARLVDHDTYHERDYFGETALMIAVEHTCAHRTGALLAAAPPDCSGHLLFGSETWVYHSLLDGELLDGPPGPDEDVDPDEIEVLSLKQWLIYLYDPSVPPPAAQLVIDTIDQQISHMNAFVHLALVDLLPVVPLASLVSSYLLADP
jgi:hypothetical protein